MNFENFALSRDIGYLAFALTGAALGLFARLIPFSAVSLKKRSRIISVVFLIFAVVIALFALSVIQSRGKIFLIKEFYFFGIAALVLCGLALRFFRAAALPLLVLAGFLVVASGLFLRPLVKINGPETVLAEIGLSSESGDRAYFVQIPKTRGRTGTYPLEIDPQGGTELQSGIAPQRGTELQALPFPELRIRSLYIRFDDMLPFLGGTVFGAISSIRDGDRALYTFTPPLESRLIPQEPDTEKHFPGIISIVCEAAFNLDHPRPDFPARITARPLVEASAPRLLFQKPAF